ncbi:3-oxoacyl-[acyl-carrier protein] reductase [Brevibacterium siliguriense]|uniref:3-oxoacyl-[acyl-carrier protein] reductase n=1 Tax=Brevibacterium siliguriense TaxID=1136497 RepID=A0A1H1SB86_9MICO|nr:SDR family oxidoreductase [Brevibacterium siliguriense]SDS45143.1 3-oxoacyl-[acyl-carrier protein] reductase [Brevibacterium siliguriense]
MPTVLITGSGRDSSIAAGVSARLATDGWTVCTSDLDAGDYPCDLSSAQEAEKLVGRVRRDHGTIDGLVLSHAHGEESGILDTTAKSFDRHLAVNARASLLLIAAFARQVSESGGAIVAFTSDHTTGNLPYGASKGALDRIVISAARELGPKKISANVVNPGPIDTGWMDDETRTGLAPYQPLGRMGTPHDVAGVTAFLLSAEGGWINGQIFSADGGFSARY